LIVEISSVIVDVALTTSIDKIEATRTLSPVSEGDNVGTTSIVPVAAVVVSMLTLAGCR
jgi:hypothetical protein